MCSLGKSLPGGWRGREQDGHFRGFCETKGEDAVMEMKVDVIFWDLCRR
jgi:hypothetical protein